MEKLKSLIPDNLKKMVENSDAASLLQSSSSLLQLFLSLQQFHEMVGVLAEPNVTCCGKSKNAALDLKREGNRWVLGGDHNKALICYSQALRVAPIDADDMDKNLVATLFLNRANVLHKLGFLAEGVQDCGRALQMYPCYAKAWYRRGKINAALRNYKDAIRDFTISKSFETSLGGRKQVERELNMVLDHQIQNDVKEVKHSVQDLESGVKDRVSVVLDEIKLQCVSTSDKGRGMASGCDIPQTSLVHVEEPFSVIISKSCRETHCHYCLKELPVDMIPCPSCDRAVYCSEKCQARSGGKASRVEEWKKDRINNDFSIDLAEYIASITSSNNSYIETEHILEHQHECQGVSWPAVLPSDVVLAGRLLMKATNQGRVSMEVLKSLEILDLSHSYSRIHRDRKLELHMYSIVLLWCLSKSCKSKLSVTAVSVSQIVIVLAQIKVNSMAIVSMKSSGSCLPINPSTKVSVNDITQGVEQVRVGQAIYMTASLLNHSCKPNIHVYFLSRKLFVRTTESIAAGSPLELSYGPEVGKWNCKDRRRFLEDEYFFRCQCRGCLEINMSDLVINGFHCENLNCSGVVLDCNVARCEAEKLKEASADIDTTSFWHHSQVGKPVNNDVSEVATTSLVKNDNSFHINPGRCLKCGSFRDLEALHEAMDKAWIPVRRLEDMAIRKEIPVAAVSDALRSLDLLKSILHPYNRDIAEAEDKIAHACCVAGDLQAARQHCTSSIKILEKLYHRDHIVIGHELVKLASIQLSLGEPAAADSINRMRHIFYKYYASHSDPIFRHLRHLKDESHKLLV